METEKNENKSQKQQPIQVKDNVPRPKVDNDSLKKSVEEKNRIIKEDKIVKK